MLRRSDQHWERIREHFPEEYVPEGRAGHKSIPAGKAHEALLWPLNIGARWQMPPLCYPIYRTVHRRAFCRHAFRTATRFAADDEIGSRDHEERFNFDNLL